jgi:hypothetical protein
MKTSYDHRDPAAPAAELTDPQLPDPRTVLCDSRLPRAEKVAKLRRWAYDARTLDVANEEGMRGASLPSNLPAILAALHELGASDMTSALEP